MHQKNTSCSVTVLIASNCKDSGDFARFIQPYLDHFGIPHTVTDISSTVISDTTDFGALILAGHSGVMRSVVSAGCAQVLERAVGGGCGFVGFDPEIRSCGREMFGVTFKDRGATAVSRTITIRNNHYITAMHSDGERIPLLKETVFPVTAPGCGLITLADADGGAVILAGAFGKGSVVLFGDYMWMSHSVLGPLMGMDDLIWRGVAWAARKPFIMQWMPRFVTMRVDDVWGSLRSGRSDGLYWVETCNRFGIKPWLGVFMYNISDRSIDTLRELVTKGNATMFPHAFAGPNQTVTESGLLEDWAYFDHRNSADYPDSTMRLNEMKTAFWIDKCKIPVSTFALSHWFELGTNSLAFIAGLGCEFVGTHMDPGKGYRVVDEGDSWLVGGPFRKSEYGNRTANRPVYYADYLPDAFQPGCGIPLFNCVCEFREGNRIEWAPTNDVADTIDRAVLHLTRAFQSHALGTLYTHESDFIQFISPDCWEEIVKGIVEGVGVFDPIHTTMDEACRYVRAKHDIRIIAVENSSDGIALHIEGKNDRATFGRLFKDDAQGGIVERDIEIPQISEPMRFVVEKSGLCRRV